MKVFAIKSVTVVVAGLLLTGCQGKTESKTEADPLPWSRVQQVEVSNDGQSQTLSAQQDSAEQMVISPGASESQVILAWGVPDYILDSQDDPQRKIWQYRHALVVFQDKRVEQVLPR